MSVKRYSGTGAALNANPISFNITDQYRDDLPTSITIQASGTFTATVTFEGSVDGTNWYTLVGYDPTTSGAALASTLTATAQVRTIPLIGNFFRARVSAYTSGTVVLEALTTYNDNTPWPSGTAGSTAVTGAVTVTGSVQPVGGATTTANTQSRLNAAATTNATLVKASAGNLYNLNMTNNSAATKFVKFFNKATAPVPGTDAPVLVFAIPAGQTVNVVYEVPWRFATGIGFAITGLGTDADATAVAAGDVLLAYDWA